MTSRHLATATLGLSLAITAAGCAGDEPLETVVRNDSADVMIVASEAAGWVDGRAWTVNPDPILDLSRTGAGPDHEFLDVVDAAQLADRTIVVADRHELRFFSAEGLAEDRMGGEGQGPGEYQRLANVAILPGDSLAVYDYWLSRLTVLGPDRVVARTMRIDGVEQPRPLLPVPGGYVALARDRTGLRQEEGLRRTPASVLRIRSDGRVTDTLTRLPGFESVRFSLGTAGALWGRGSHIAVHEERIYLGSADRMEYQVRSVEGRLLEIVRVPGFDLSLSEEQVEAERRARMPDPEAAGQVTREIMAVQPDRRMRPAYERIVVDELGFVWLAGYQGLHESKEPASWQVFDPDGAWLGAVILPPRFEAFRIGPDWVLGLRRDDLDVQHVQLLRLER